MFIRGYSHLFSHLTICVSRPPDLPCNHCKPKPFLAKSRRLPTAKGGSALRGVGWPLTLFPDLEIIIAQTLISFCTNLFSITKLVFYLLLSTTFSCRAPPLQHNYRYDQKIAILAQHHFFNVSPLFPTLEFLLPFPCEILPLLSALLLG